MSLTDKVIKNTIYHFISQILNFLFPIILTPFIINKIGQVEYGIYAIVMGVVGTFGLLDLSISTSFIKFISEYYNKNDEDRLNKFINSGIVFYLLFSTVLFVLALINTNYILSLFNIPPELYEAARVSLIIGLIIFYIATSFTILVSVLISLQRMYITSFVNLILGFLSFVMTIILLNLGFRITGIMTIQLVSTVISTIINIIIVKRYIKNLKFRLSSIDIGEIKKMFKFGIQMQISKMASFSSEKLDEFLLGYFSVLNNVTYFNVANRISRFGRFFPFQLFIQGAPVAAELNAKEDREKLSRLFTDLSKYLIISSYPIFMFIFLFADLIINTWLGPGYDISIHILRILVSGQIINMTISAPGNSIIPNTGIPKYLMYEGIINLILNVVLSFILIKTYGILGAAIGNTIAIILSSAYIYYTSTKFFSQKSFRFIFSYYLFPLLYCIIAGIITYGVYYIINIYLSIPKSMIAGYITLAVIGALFFTIYIFLITRGNYLNENDKNIFRKLIYKVVPIKSIIKNEDNL